MTKTSKALPSPQKATHQSLNLKARKLGATMGSRLRSSKVFQLQNPSSHKASVFLQINANKLLLNKKKFGAFYRSRWSDQDELISTSTVRELIDGVLSSGKKFTADEEKELTAIFDNISRVRLPTRFSGYATQTEIMQHPTAKGKGYFAESATTARKHAASDTARKEFVISEMEDESRKPGSTATDITKRGIRAAISFTLNEFTAPITASDVKPYSKMASILNTDPRMREQIKSRELLKSVYGKLGGSQESSTDWSLSRSWGTTAVRQSRTLSRSVSPPRNG